MSALELEDIAKEENGKFVTNIDVQPPSPWTNDFEAVGSYDWLENGQAVMNVQMAGINDKPKPLFADLGEQKVIFQAGNSYYVYHMDGSGILHIVDPSDLETIVSALESGCTVESFQLDAQ